MTHRRPGESANGAPMERTSGFVCCCTCPVIAAPPRPPQRSDPAVAQSNVPDYRLGWPVDLYVIGVRTVVSYEPSEIHYRIHGGDRILR